MRNSRGFTLIELLVVIAIIGILSSVVLASLNSARQKGRDARRLSDIKQIQLALELYYDANSSEYPDTLTPLATTYIAVVPTPPGGTTATSYSYANVTSAGAACTASSGNCSSYVLGTLMEGTVPAGSVTGTIGGTGDSVNCSATGMFCVRP